MSFNSFADHLGTNEFEKSSLVVFIVFRFEISDGQRCRNVVRSVAPVQSCLGLDVYDLERVPLLEHVLFVGVAVRDEADQYRPSIK